MIYGIIEFPDRRLTQKSQPVEVVDGTIKKLMFDMLETMYAANGIGLSAVQIGVMKRIVVIDLQDNGVRSPIMMVNPEIIETSDSINSSINEGCLSVPTLEIVKNRHSSIKVKYIDENGMYQVIEMSELLSVCFQHEFDHLNGITIAKTLSPLKQRSLASKLKKNN